MRIAVSDMFGRTASRRSAIQLAFDDFNSGVDLCELPNNHHSSHLAEYEPYNSLTQKCWLDDPKECPSVETILRYL